MRNNFDKELIKRNFEKAAETYDENAALQKEVGEELISLLPTLKNQRILDMGCGTGTLMKGLKTRYPCSSIFGYDLSYPMLIKAGTKLDSNSTLIGGDSEALPFKVHSFDTVISNLTYQWVEDVETAFGEIFRILKPGGIFIFSTLGPKTLRELKSSKKEAENRSGKNGSPPTIVFPELEHSSMILEKIGFTDIQINAVIKKKIYKDLWELLKTLKGIGAINPSKKGKKTLARGISLKEINRTYKEKFSTSYGIEATYEIINASARKL